MPVAPSKRWVVARPLGSVSTVPNVPGVRGNNDRRTRRGTCLTCKRDIVNEGRGWYHAPGTRPPIGHFAEPMAVPDERP
jgi:hypothetical protein